MPTQAVQLQSSWRAHQRHESKRGTAGRVSGPSAHTTIPAPPGTDPPPLTCPCTMAFSRASTACRASGGRSGCSRSETASQSASTACCQRRDGNQGVLAPQLKGQYREQRTEKNKGVF